MDGGKVLFTANVSVVDAENGKVIIHFPHTATRYLELGTKIYFDIKITWPDGTVKNYPWPPLQATVVEPMTP